MSHTEVVLVIVAAGIAGGTINYALSRTENSTFVDWWWSVVVGLGASSLVPLFLNTISSSLLSGLLNGSASESDIYVFAGFCLLGAIASKAMIQTLTQRVLAEARATRNDVEALKEEVAPIIAKESEVPKHPHVAGLSAKGFSTDEQTRNVVEALGSKKYSWRYFGGIMDDTGLQHAQIQQTLDWLVANGLAVKSQGNRGDLWGLTPDGRNLLAAIEQTKSQ